MEFVTATADCGAREKLLLVIHGVTRPAAGKLVKVNVWTTLLVAELMATMA